MLFSDSDEDRFGGGPRQYVLESAERQLGLLLPASHLDSFNSK
jgi:hypothetical protein